MSGKVWAFDFDDTLNLPGPRPGPIDVQDLYHLKNEGDIVGICGDYYWAFKVWPDVWKVINFWGPLNTHNKASFLGTIRMDIQRTQPLFATYTLVGNTRADAMQGLVAPTSQDDGWARLANWRFIKEIDFARGKR